MYKSYLYSLRHPFSLFKKRIQPKLINNIESKQIGFSGAKYYYNQIINNDKNKYFPMYTSILFSKFPFLGSNPRSNFQIYLRHIKIFNTSKEYSSEFEKQFNSLFDINWKSFGVAFILSCVITYFLMPSKMKQIGNSKPFQGKNNEQKGEQLINANTFDDKMLVNKLLQNLKEVHIKQAKPDYPQFTIQLVYQDKTAKQFRYNGNINNFLSMLEKYQEAMFDKTKVYFDYQQYTVFQAFGDAFGLLGPFVGIFITFYIFRKFSPETMLSKLNRKKTFKVQALKDIKTKFDDVAGMEQAKKQITQFVDFLKHGQKYRQIGAKIPKGALLTGPPGTGKTMLAKACAGQAGVAFFSISGSQFVQMFVGLGASKVRDLFAQARMQAPSIIFIDQIDAIGKKRETSRNQQKDSTLNQLLVQMDGFSSHQTVIILAATNRKDVLDSALTRPGRFDRMVQVSLPDLKARQAIFKIHLKPLKIDPNRKIQDLAKRLSDLSPGFSGADIANLCNQAAIIATRRNKNYIEDKDFQDASQKITAGYEKKNLVNPNIKKRVAYHQAGHAVCGWFLKGGNPLVKLTIIPRSKGALGYAQYLPKSSYIQTKQELIDRIAILLGGLTSQQILLNSSSTGASDDLQKVYQIARKMIAEYGMGKSIYNITMDEESYVRKQSQYMLKKVDEQMNNLIEQSRMRCRTVLSQHKEQLQSLSRLLLQKETINGDDIKNILGQRPAFN